MHYQIRLCIVMFHALRFEPHTCIVVEGFSALEMHLFLLLALNMFHGKSGSFL